MACLGQPGCMHSEYQPHIKTVTPTIDPHTPPKDKEKCLAMDQRMAVEKKAKEELIAACTAMNEKVECPNDCECSGEGAFPTDKDGPVWTTIKPNLTWTKTETSPLGCKFKVKIDYDLQYRERGPGKCYKKAPPSPE